MKPRTRLRIAVTAVAIAAAIPTAASPSAAAPTAGAAPDVSVAPFAPADATIVAFGAAAFRGSTARIPSASPIVDLAVKPNGQGYWTLAANGEVHAFGAAADKGNAIGMLDGGEAAAIAASASGNGYWVLTSRGRVLRFGDAGLYGSVTSMRPNARAVDIEGTPNGHGYWVLTSNGDVRTFGNAGDFGGLADRPLAYPAVGIAIRPAGDGYWILTGSGNVRPFGAATGYGHGPPGSPAVGIAPTPIGRGYWVARASGEVEAFGNARDLGGTHDLVGAIAAHPNEQGFWLARHMVTLEPGDSGPHVVRLQQALVAAGYWTQVDGYYGYQTLHAVTAVQKVRGLARTGIYDAPTRAALAMGRPRPRGTDDRAEVDLSRQVTLIARGGRTLWVFDVSTGAPSTPTRPGLWRVFRTDSGRTASCAGCLYRPIYFDGGRAFHGYISVPPYAASHGCVRTTNAEQDFIWSQGLIPMGSVVAVYW